MDRFRRCGQCDSDRFVWQRAAEAERHVVIDEEGVAWVSGRTRLVVIEGAKGIVRCAECGRTQHFLKNVILGPDEG